MADTIRRAGRRSRYRLRKQVVEARVRLEESEQRKQQTEDQNRRNQEAILRLLDEMDDPRQRAVAADAAPLADGQRLANLLLRQGITRPIERITIDLRRGPAEERPVGRLVVVLIDEGPQADVEIVQGAQLADKVQASLPERPPEALHFSARGGVIGTGVKQGDSQSLAADAEHIAAVGGAVVQIQRIGSAVATQRRHHQIEHVLFLLGGVGPDGHDIARSVVQQGVDAHGLGDAAAVQDRAVTDIGVP